VAWYRRAAQQGLLRAQFNLGLCHLYGTGVRKNQRVARLWLRRAASAGHKNAKEIIRRK
jgi:TPR repeat protein